MIVKPTPAEEFRQRVTLLQRNANWTNELNETEPRLVPLGRAWAKVSPSSATELEQNAQNTLDVTHEVRLRYNPELSHADTVQFRGRLLDVLSLIDVDEQHVELQLLCHEQKP